MTVQKLFIVKTTGLISIALTVAMLVSPAGGSHKFHVSVSQVEYDEKSRKLELVIRVFADDFENALSGFAKRPVRPDQLAASSRAGELVMGYLRGAVEIRDRGDRPLSLTWSGMEGQTDVWWLYLEAKAPAGIDGARMRNRIFCELFDDQVNIVNTKVRGKQVGTLFEHADDFKPITKKM